MAITIEFRAFFSPLNDIAMPDAINLGRWAMAKQRVGEMKGRWLEVASRRWGTSFLEPQSELVTSLKVPVLKLESWQLFAFTALTANRSSQSRRCCRPVLCFKWALTAFPIPK